MAFDPASIAAIASAITTLIFTKAIEKGGENLGELAFSKISQMFNFIQEKFQQEGVEGKLLKAKKDPSAENKKRFQEELTYLMQKDAIFAQNLQMLIDKLQSEPQVSQILLKGIRTTGDAEISNVEQMGDGNSTAQQEALTDLEIGGKLKISQVKQQNSSEQPKRKRFWFF